jgi:hypothetical protein
MPAVSRSGKRPLLADALAAALFLGGCLTNQTADQPQDLNGETSLLTQEVDDMGALSLAAASPSVAGNADAALAPPKFDAACQCHVRSLSFKTDAGFSRERVDSIYFLDAGDRYLRFPTLAHVRKVLHKRLVRQSKGGRAAEIHIVTGMLLSPGSSDTTGTWNGEISGYYGGHAYREGKIAGVTRKLKDRRWQFPESGALEVKGGNASLKLNFAGGTAQAVRADLQTGKSVAITVDSGYRERLGPPEIIAASARPRAP